LVLNFKSLLGSVMSCVEKKITANQPPAPLMLLPQQMSCAMRARDVESLFV